MADVKISALPLASTPLAGTEVLPIVQSATTDQVSVANLTAGRAVSAASLTLTTTPLAVGSGGTGLSSFTAGYVPYASSTSALSFSSGLISDGTNLGLGVTPSAWQSGRRAFQINGATGGGISLHSAAISQAVFGANNYFDGTNYVYLNNGFATLYQQLNGTQFWSTAPSGTAGTAITFTQAMTLGSNGNLGIGQTNPAYPVDTLQGNLGNTAGNTIQPFRMITNSGNADYFEGLWIRTASASGWNNATFRLRRNIDGTGGPQWIDYGANGALGFATSNTVQTTIDSSGNLLVGTTSPDARLVASKGTNDIIGRIAQTASSGITTDIFQVTALNHATSTSMYLIRGYTSGPTAQFAVRSDGVIYAQNTTVQSISDRRVKENITLSMEGLDVISGLRPVRFDFKSGFGNNRKNQLGFIAQEVETVFADAVETSDEKTPDGDYYKTVGPGAFIPVIVKAIQELAAKVQALEAKVA